MMAKWNSALGIEVRSLCLLEKFSIDFYVLTLRVSLACKYQNYLCVCHGGYVLDKWSLCAVLSTKLPVMIESETAKIYKMWVWTSALFCLLIQTVGENMKKKNYCNIVVEF